MVSCHTPPTYQKEKSHWEKCFTRDGLPVIHHLLTKKRRAIGKNVVLGKVFLSYTTYLPKMEEPLGKRRGFGMPVEWVLSIVAPIFMGKDDIRNCSCNRAVKLLEHGKYV